MTDTPTPPTSPELVVTFPDGLPGFERCRRFLLYANPETHPVRLLHAIEGPDAAFLTIETTRACEGYRHQLSAPDRVRLEADDSTPLLWLALVTVEEEGPMTANLRAPIVINLEKHLGFQIMPHQCVYPLRHPLAQAA